ncbi:MAG: ECF transporter S component [Bacillota bacterium]|nr:ECF transporter S component [Bacillota bacterium]
MDRLPPPEGYVIKEILHILLFISLVCLIMPFIEVRAAGDYTAMFSVYDLGVSFHRSEISMALWNTDRALVTSVKVIAWILAFATFICLFISYNPNRAKAGSTCFFPLLVASGISLGILAALYFYVGWVAHQGLDPEAVFSLRAGGVVYLLVMAAVFILCLMKTLKRRTVATGVLVLLLIPATIMFGVYFLDDRQYMAVSLLIILEIMLPFFVLFENRKPEAREIIVIAVVAALAAAGRAAFFMVPHFKPVLAIVIIAAIALGPQAGFLVGAMAEFVSNFLFGQGPWTPWQMFAFGIVGFLTGLIYKKGLLPKKLPVLCVYGFVMAVTFCGVLLDTSVIFTTASEIKSASAVAIYISGFPVNVVHGVATAIFLYFLTNPMCDKIERVKKKYGILEP